MAPRFLEDIVLGENGSDVEADKFSDSSDEEWNILNSLILCNYIMQSRNIFIYVWDQMTLMCLNLCVPPSPEVRQTFYPTSCPAIMEFF